MFEPYLSAWGLVPDGNPIVTHAARLLPVRRLGEPAMLKLSNGEDERGAIVMEWWDGDGAARVLARDGDALLLERAMGSASLSEMARTGRDVEACRILCATADRLHARRARPQPHLTPLERRRLLSWIVAWTGLSAAWFLADADPLDEIDLAIARLAAAELDRMA
jgi:streptomycin 6-kinase